MKTRPALSRLALATASALSLPAGAVQLGSNGLGQALIYPYYTVRASQGENAFNTYLSVVNSTSAAKAIRVRMREGRAGRAVLDFNLYLSPNDVWAGAVVPTATGTQLISVDSSCTDPAFTSSSSGPAALALSSNGYTGANADGFGDTLDRTREGYVEIIEMATLAGASAAAITHNSAGVPANCAAIRASASPVVGPPTGGLSGTLTLINVNNGQDFTLDATALADLTTRQFFRPASDPYPDFAAAEIDPVSAVVTGGILYRSTWTRAVDAVSAVLMSPGWAAEFVMDNGTASLTDVVATLPTRHHYVSANGSAAPFTASNAWSPTCSLPGPNFVPVHVGEQLLIPYFTRDGREGQVADTCSLDCRKPGICAASGVTSVANSATHLPTDTSRTFVLGSTAFGLGIGFLPMAGVQNGWLEFQTLAATFLTSLPGSTRMDVATGQTTSGVHRHAGLPIVGFSVRTFANGTLQCDGAARCQGNYGGAFPLKLRRSITTP